ncbi:MAG TPA: hypothetical protein VMU05_08995 [Dongiaceae bacterium]|nr:hypothetical protein [Dongiaceae bacterium]
MRKILLMLNRHIWSVCFLVLMLAGVYAAYQRSVAVPLITDTHLPWSLPGALNVVCGTALAAGGFTLAAIIRTLHLARAQSLLRICVTSSFLGYLVACLGILVDKTVLTRICALHSNWTTNRVTTAVDCAFVLFGISVAVEFASDLHFPPKRKPVAATLAVIRTPLLWSDAGVSLLFQSIVASALKLTPNASKFWASPWLAFLFFISSACAGLALALMAYLLAHRAPSNAVDATLLNGTRRILATLVFLYVYGRVADLFERGQFSLLGANLESSMLILEMALFIVPMFVLASQPLPTVGVVFYCSATILAGLVANRLNTFVTSLEMGTQHFHLAPWHDFAISYSIVVVGIVGYQLLANRLRIQEISRAEEVTTF